MKQPKESIVKVTNITEYLGKIKEFENAICNEEQYELHTPVIYYRGEKRTYINPNRPSVYRRLGGVAEDEYFLLNKASRIMWKYLSGINSHVDRLAFLQHHGFPTRLLDVTTNPLVALYFACENDVTMVVNKKQTCKELEEAKKSERQQFRSKDGVVFIGKSLTIFDGNVAEEIVSWIFNYSNNAVFKKQKLEQYFNYYNGNINKEWLRNQMKKQHLIQSSYCDERIHNQKGLFLMGPVLDKHNTEDYEYAQSGAPKFEDWEQTKIVIPADKKDSILKDLATLGISKGTLFPTIENQLNDIFLEYKNQQEIDGFEICH